MVSDMGSADGQKAMNRQTWQALRDEGVSQGQALDVDAFFFADSQASADAVAGDLTAEGWTKVSVDSSKVGLLRRKLVWSVSASRSLPAAGPAAFDDMVDRLEAIASRHDAEFDGWGAEVD